MTRIHAQSPSRSAHAAAQVIARRLARSFSTSSFGSPRSLEQIEGATPTAPSPDGYEKLASRIKNLSLWIKNLSPY